MSEIIILVIAFVVLMIVFFVLGIILHLFIINFFELTDEEKEKLDVNTRDFNPMGQNYPNDNWTRFN